MRQLLLFRTSCLSMSHLLDGVTFGLWTPNNTFSHSRRCGGKRFGIELSMG